MQFGAHIAGGGSLVGTIEKAKRVGVDCLQMFASPPSNWNKSRYNDEQMAEFKTLLKQNKIGPNFFHAIYLLNLGSDNPELLTKTIESLVHYLTIAPKMGVMGAIFHTGSHKGSGFEAVVNRVQDTMNEILANTPKASRLIIENNAGQGNLIGRNAEEIAQIIEGIKEQDRVAVCLDTCHAFANGTDWRIEEEVDRFVKEYDRLVSWERVIAIHANDSKFEVGNNKDRHQNIGEGFIGEQGFRNILAHPKFQNLPFFIETPGFDNDGPDKKNLDRLRQFAGKNT